LKANKLQAAAEAVLFACGDPIHINKISDILGISTSQTRQILLNIQAKLDDNGSGICLVIMGDLYQLCARDEFKNEVRRVLDISRNTPLKQASLEVLAIVAYNQPVTKAFVEQVRGVDCSGVLSTLCQKGLVEEKGRMDLPGRPLIYGTTPEFLRSFCISSLDELPPLPESSDCTAEVQGENNL
jgi:segregation and condensation protein B